MVRDHLRKQWNDVLTMAEARHRFWEVQQWIFRRNARFGRRGDESPINYERDHDTAAAA